jgi:hypothetical protein
VDPHSAVGSLAESAPSGLDLDAKKRAVLAPEDRSGFESLLTWSDGLPLLARRRVESKTQDVGVLPARRLGTGQTWIVTLPFGADASDLPLRPLFLALLDAWTTEARARMSPRRTEAGVAWTFPEAHVVQGEGPAPGGPGGIPPASEPVHVSREAGEPRIVPATLGVYHLTIDGKKETRVVAPVRAEMNLASRAIADTAMAKSLGDSRAAIDASPVLALALLGLMMIELVLRLRARTRETLA